MNKGHLRSKNNWPRGDKFSSVTGRAFRIMPISMTARRSREIIEITNRHERDECRYRRPALINFENNFVASSERGEDGGRRRSRKGWMKKGGGRWWEGKQFRPEISIKAKRRKSAPAVTVNFSSGLHLTAA